MNGAQTQQIIKDYLVSRGKAAEEARYLVALAEALNWVNENVAQDIFPLAAIGSENVDTRERQAAATEKLFEFLDQAVQPVADEIKFQSKNACQIKKLTFDAAKIYVERHQLYEAPHNLGIRELYTRQSRTSDSAFNRKQHWLTDVDVKRTLATFGYEPGTVKTLPFESSYIRAMVDLELKAHRRSLNPLEPLEIPIMLSNSVDGSQGSHWIAATITIRPSQDDPSTLGKISYKITDSLAISPQKVEHYQQIMEDALADKPGEFHNPFAAADGVSWSLADDNVVAGTGLQNADGHTCGYRALHSLLSDSEAFRARGNDKAREYAAIDAGDGNGLVSAVYQAQLEGLTISAAEYEALGVCARGKFVEAFGDEAVVKVIDEAKLADFLAGRKPEEEARVQTRNEAVAEVVDEFTLSSKLVIFPKGKQDSSLGASEYNGFFDELSEQLEQASGSQLKIIQLPYINSDALDGISAFFAEHPQAISDTLVYNFSLGEMDDSKSVFKSKLMFNLAKLSKAGQNKIELQDSGNIFVEEDWLAILEFVKQQNITCEIQLPTAFAKTALQRQFQVAHETAIQRRNIKALAQDSVGDATRLTTKKRDKVVLQRAKIDFENAEKSAEIELQDAIEAEVTVEIAVREVRKERSFEVGKVFSEEMILEAIERNEFKSLSELDPVLSKETFISRWHTLAGNLAVGEIKLGRNTGGADRRLGIKRLANQHVVLNSSNFAGISKAALEKIMREVEFPKGGIDFENLPVGFVLVPSEDNPDNFVLHYEADFRDENSSIFYQLSEQKGDVEIISSVVDRLVAGLEASHANNFLKKANLKLQSSETFSGLDHHAYREVMWQLASMPEDQKVELFALFGITIPSDLTGEELTGDLLLSIGKYFELLPVLEKLNADSVSEEDFVNYTNFEIELLLRVEFGGDESVTDEVILQRMVALAKQISHSDASREPSDSVIFVLMSSETTAKVEAAIETFNLTYTELQGLLQVYSSYGDAGIERLLDNWQQLSALDNFDLGKYQSITRNVDGYVGMVAGSAMLKACEQVKSFTGADKAWFEALYVNHEPKDSADFVQLVEQFMRFKSKVASDGLELYDISVVDEPFTSGVNMSVAMARMLTILNKCKATERNAQWQVMAQLDLSEVGAIKGLRDTIKPASAHSTKVRSDHYQFILPIMALERPEAADAVSGYYQPVKETQELFTPSGGSDAERKELMQKNFFRFVAVQKHRMPLDFYLRAVEQIEALSTAGYKDIDVRDAQEILYRLLAEMTTGEHYQFFIDDEHQAQAQWDAILSGLKSAKLDIGGLRKFGYEKVLGGDPDSKIFAEITTQLGNLPNVPSLSIMERLVKVLTSPIRKFEGDRALKNSLAALVYSNNRLTAIADVYGDDIYNGMKHYTQTDYESTTAKPAELKSKHIDLSKFSDQLTLFDYHVVLAYEINAHEVEQSKTHEQEFSYGFSRFLIPLVSTFKVKIENVSALNDAYNAIFDGLDDNSEKIASMMMTYIGKHLANIENPEDLDPAILIEILNSYQPIVQELSKELATRISAKELALMDKLTSRELSKEEQKPIIAEFAKLNPLFHYFKGVNDFKTDAKGLLLNTVWHKEAPVDADTIEVLPDASLASGDIELTHILSDHLEHLPQLEGAFDSGYFTKALDHGAEGKVKFFLDTNFKDAEIRQQVDEIRTHFDSVDEVEMLRLLEDINDVLHQAKSSAEQKEILQYLTDELLTSEPIADYRLLLDAMLSVGSGPFIYYMQLSKEYLAQDSGEEVRKIDNISQKAAFFIKDALPNLYKGFKHLSVVEFAPMIASAINSGHGEELTQEITVDERYQAHLDLAGLIKSAGADGIAALLHQIETASEYEALREGVTSLKAFGTLKAHLEDLATEAFETITDDDEAEISKQAYDTGMADPKDNVRYRTEETIKERGVVSGFFMGLIGNKTYTETKYFKITTTTREEPVVKRFDADILEALSQEITNSAGQFITYGYALKASLQIVDDLIEKYPTAKSLIVPFASELIGYQQQVEDESAKDAHIKHAYAQLTLLAQELNNLQNKDVVISLCEHFSASGQYNFTDLMAIFNGQAPYEKFAELSTDKKVTLFKAVTALLNNDKDCSLVNIQQQLALLASPDGDIYQQALATTFSKAPFPELSQMKEWWEKPEIAEIEGEAKVAELAKLYKNWSTAPVSREEAVNGFDLEFAKTKVKDIGGRQYSDEELEQLSAQVQKVRTEPTESLLAEIAQYRSGEKDSSSAESKMHLTALMAELLYRTKGLSEEADADGKRKYGRSFEINTTQYLALYSLLSSDKSTIAGIGTGEGKSRIMMLSIAAQWAMGKTVDFVTADVSLATRDYLEYQAFFSSFGAETNLITAQTPANEYRRDGINFSDPANLSLFRNKARSEGNSGLVLPADRAQRCLLLDEADKTLFDTVDTRYNYSAEADKSIGDMPWVYEDLVAFFEDKIAKPSLTEDPKELGSRTNEECFHGAKSDAEECNARFNAFIASKYGANSDHVQRIKGLSRKQLEAWQKSALVALNLKYGEDFALEAKVSIITKQGPATVNQARFIEGGIASKTAKFSFGVHQCLHARLNRLKTRLASSSEAVEPGSLEAQLKKADYAVGRFPVDSENQIIYSSSSKALTDDYDVIRGVTGTPGAWVERAEKSGMSFIDIPRHRGLKRKDSPYQITKDSSAQHQVILNSVRERIANQQPILLICENDTESQELATFLKANLTEEEMQHFNRVDASTSIKDEQEIVENEAGKPGAITIATARLGRGTDIKLHDESKIAGLHVLGTYLPRTRDYIQIVGRAGRFGAEGSTQFVFNADAMKKNGMVPDELFTATEDYLHQQQEAADLFIQKQRIIKDAVGDFRMSLTKNFFEDFYRAHHLEPEFNKEDAVDNWRKFFDDSDKAWNKAWPVIAEALANEDLDTVKREIDAYQEEVVALWGGMKAKLDVVMKTEFTDDLKGQADITAVKISKDSAALIGYKANPAKQLWAPVIGEGEYSKAYDGRAVVIDGFWENFRKNTWPAIKCIVGGWFGGNSEPTPFLKAWRNNNITTKQFWQGGDDVAGKAQIEKAKAAKHREEHPESMEAVDIDEPSMDARDTEEGTLEDRRGQQLGRSLANVMKRHREFAEMVDSPELDDMREAETLEERGELIPTTPRKDTVSALGDEQEQERHSTMTTKY